MASWKAPERLQDPFMVIDNYPHYVDKRPDIQSRSLDDFLDGADTAVIIPWLALDEAGNNMTDKGRELALKSARDYAGAKQPLPFDLVHNNCEAFAVLCWTGRCDRHQITTVWLQSLVAVPQTKK
ncbi:TPA: hypothetical protein ACH3X1_013505 [Trebouxia sp. C0004]